MSKWTYKIHALCMWGWENTFWLKKSAYFLAVLCNRIYVGHDDCEHWHLCISSRWGYSNVWTGLGNLATSSRAASSQGRSVHQRVSNLLHCSAVLQSTCIVVVHSFWEGTPGPMVLQTLKILQTSEGISKLRNLSGYSKTTQGVSEYSLGAFNGYSLRVLLTGYSGLGYF